MPEVYLILLIHTLNFLFVNHFYMTSLYIYSFIYLLYMTFLSFLLTQVNITSADAQALK